MTEKNYRKTTKVFCDKIKGVAETLTQEASVELHGTTPPDQIVDVGITIDGTWQKRGFTSIYTIYDMLITTVMEIQKVTVL